MKTSFIFGILFFTFFSSFAQNNTINYKALIKDGSGNLISNENVDIRFTIFSDAVQIYQETHTTTTDANGIAIVNIGTGTTSGSFGDIKWNAGTTSLRTEIDSGSGFVDIGTTEFKSVPYALNISGLMEVTQSGNTGWQLFTEFIPDGAGRAAIGSDALDLSKPIDSSWDFMGASGTNSFAANTNNWASGSASAAFGEDNQSSGFASAAFGASNWVNGNSSLVTGFSNEVFGNASFSLGEGNVLSGNNALTIGQFSNVSGNNSQASGLSLLVSSENAVAIGENNIDDINAVFMIGNGASAGARSNALMVLKSGNTSINGRLTVTDNSIFTNAIDGIKSYPTGNFVDSPGVYGENSIDDYYGIGVQGRGGYIGVNGFVSGTGSLFYYGIFGSSSTITGLGTTYGVYGSANGGETNYAVYAAGDLAHTGALINASDRKLKTNIQPVTNALSSIQQLNPTTYSIKPEYIKKMNMSDASQIGFIAQELQQVFPNLVTSNVHQGNSKTEKPTNYLGVNYIGLIPVLTAGIKEQQTIIEQQQQTIDAQQRLLQDLLARVEVLENR